MKRKVLICRYSVVGSLLVVAVMYFVLLLFESYAFGQDLIPRLELVKKHPKMESILLRLVEKCKQVDKTAAQELAKKRGMVVTDDRVRVVLEPLLNEDISGIDQDILLSYGVKIEVRSKHLLQVQVPILALEEVAEKVPGVRYVYSGPQNSDNMLRYRQGQKGGSEDGDHKEKVSSSF